MLLHRPLIITAVPTTVEAISAAPIMGTLSFFPRDRMQKKSIKSFFLFDLRRYADIFLQMLILGLY
jgi:hypothetical protein